MLRRNTHGAQFILYVPNEEDGCVYYELDGLQTGPIRVGSYKKEDGDENSNNGSSEDNSTSMDWIRVARNAIQNCLANYSPTEINKRTYLTERLNDLAAISMEESDPSMLSVRSKLLSEEEKRAQWTAEIERRQYNYPPFCVELLRCLAGSGKFDGLVEKARESVGGKRKRAEAWKAKSSK